ncbi:hypothetical protein OAH36_02350 [Verrucomicrobia bacterium]|jgi:hypothetical protein|nr:hypothetical protein [Verrucomicrobiota bacterium]MDB4798418.1 hypothetical protein [Verrucomicrobiota bacterium]
MKTIIESFPTLVILSVVAFFVLLIAAWLLSIRGGFKSEKSKALRLFLIIPFTNPIAALVLLFKDRQAVSSALLCYLGAILIVPIGGLIAKKTEQANFEEYTAKLARQGISIDYKDLIPVPASDENNIWKHPFLEPMGEAGQDTEAGVEARNLIQFRSEASPYQSLAYPEPIKGVNYASDPDSNPLLSTTRSGNPFRKFHESALSILETQGGQITEDNTPTTWQAYAKLVSDFYQPAEEATRQLQEAINRPDDQYPYEWDKNFGMLLPHLTNLRTLSRTIILRAKAAAITGDASETFRMIEIGIKLAETGDSDLLISRLVQNAQTLITLEAIRVAQQFHTGSDEQWATLLQELERLDIPEKIPAALNAERAFGTGMILPMTDAGLFDMVSKINQLGNVNTVPDSPSSSIESFLRAVTGMLWGTSAQAMILYNWTQTLDAYENMITNTVSAYEKTKSMPWNECKVPSLEKEIESYGFFARLLLPALDQGFFGALEAQHQVEIAKLAITLERYYLANQAYPEKLTELAPAFTSTEPTDPMTGESWKYERLESNGFLLYSIGKDGEDDGGIFKKNARRRSSNEELDDRGWYVSPTTPELPEFSFDSPSSPSEDEVSVELMKKVGIEPGDSESNSD